jgi:alkylated DNA repair dioxygenase AlkB
VNAPDLSFHPDFISEADRPALFAALMAEVPFAPETIRMFGKPATVPRLVSWHGDAGAAYAYSGTWHEPRPWTPALAALRDRVAARAGVAFNSVLANLYRSGADSMGWHSDDEPELGPDPVIASLSFGAARRFRLKPKSQGEPVELSLSDGSLLVMGPGVQAGWRHAVPKDLTVAGPRINLTFRLVANPQNLSA